MAAGDSWDLFTAVLPWWCWLFRDYSENRNGL